MPWQLSTSPPLIFKRNTIKLAVIEARFQPLTAPLDAFISRLHATISDILPEFSHGTYQDLSISSPPQISFMEPRPLFAFSTSDGTSRAVLTPQSLALETSQYVRRSTFHQPFLKLWAALCDHIPVLSPQRLGLRFVNEISLVEVHRDIGAALTWADLIDPSLLTASTRWVGIEDAQTYAEMTAPIDPGALTLRYGFTSSQQELPHPIFRFDVDRYQDSAFSLDSLPKLLSAFGADAARLFLAAIQPRLYDWLQPTAGGPP